MADYNTGVPSAQMQGKLRKFDNIITVVKTGYGDYVCTNYASDAACIQAAINSIIAAGGGILHINKGHYNCTSQIRFTGSNIYIEGDGVETVLDFTDQTTYNGCLGITGSITSTNALLASNVSAGGETVTVASGNGTKFKAGDWVRIRSEAYCQPYVTDPIGEPWLQHCGEIQKISSVNGDVLTLNELLFGDYLTSDTATIDLVEMCENFSIKNLKIVGNPTLTQYGITIYQVHNVVVEGITSEDMRERAVFFNDVVGGKYFRNTIYRSNLQGLGYGLAIGNASRNLTVSDNHFYDCRHGVSCGGDHSYGTQYVQLWTNNIMSKGNDSVGMFGPHPTHKGLTISNNTCIGCSLGFVNAIDTVVTGNVVENANCVGFTIQSAAEGVIFSNNRISTVADHCVTVRTQKGNFTISNNELSCSAAGYDGINIAYQIKDIDVTNNRINVAGAGITVSTYSGLNDSENITIQGNEIKCTGSEPGISVVSTTYNIDDVTIKDNTIISAADGINFTCANKNITHAVVENNEVTVPATAMGISLESTGTGVYIRSSVSHNKCYGGLNCIDIVNCTDIDVIDNHVYDAAGYGLRIHSGCTDYTVDHNIIKDCATSLLNNSGITGRRITDNVGYNPVGFITAPAIPASGNGTTNTTPNNYGYPCEVCIHGGTVTVIYIAGTATGLTTGTFTIHPGQNIGLTYSSAPTWTWRGL